LHFLSRSKQRIADVDISSLGRSPTANGRSSSQRRQFRSDNLDR
jgi:hypothetical protein